jgi:hypothetical protein
VPSICSAGRGVLELAALMGNYAVTALILDGGRSAAPSGSRPAVAAASGVQPHETPRRSATLLWDNCAQSSAPVSEGNTWPYDLVIKNGMVVDGSGFSRYRADVAVKDGTIVEIGKIRGAATTTIDA